MTTEAFHECGGELYATQDAVAQLNYGFDWSKWLAESQATLDTGLWSSDAPVEDALSIDNILNDALTGHSTCRISGGVAGKQYAITNTITATTVNNYTITEVRQFILQIV